MTDNEVEINGAPEATSVRVFFCANPKCLRPHVVLMDGEGQPFAQFVVPDPRPDDGFMHDLAEALGWSADSRRPLQ